MHSLRKKKFALPDKRNYRKCKCDISKYEKYFHEEDNGVLYLGHNLKGEYIILCDTCYSIFNYNDFVWTCPVCKINFKSKKNVYQKNSTHTVNYFGDKISPKIEKNSTTMCKSPSNGDIIHRKKIIEVGPSSAENKENNSNIVKNLLIPFASSVIAQSIIALGSSRSGMINYSRKAIEEVRISRPRRAARVAYVFESFSQLGGSLSKVL